VFDFKLLLIVSETNTNKNGLKREGLKMPIFFALKKWLLHAPNIPPNKKESLFWCKMVVFPHFQMLPDNIQLLGSLSNTQYILEPFS
jgi:hypothetical protein